MAGARRHEDERAGRHLPLLLADRHDAAAADDNVDLLVVRVSVYFLPAAGRALHPGYREVPRSELPACEEQVGDLPAALVARALLKCLGVHCRPPGPSRVARTAALAAPPPRSCRPGAGGAG